MIRLDYNFIFQQLIKENTQLKEENTKLKQLLKNYM